MKNRDKLFVYGAIAAGIALAVVLAVILDLNGEERSGIDPTGAGSVREEFLDREDSIVGEGDPDGAVGGPEDRIALEGGEAPEAAGSQKGQDILPAGKGRITGVVFAEETGRVGGATIQFMAGQDISGDLALFIRLPGGGSLSKKGPEVKTGPDGWFAIDQVPAVENAYLVVSHEHFVTKKVTLGKYRGTEKDVGDLILEHAGTISGFVALAGTGRPLEGAVVSAVKTANTMEQSGGVLIFAGGMGGQSDIKTETGSDGNYILRGVPAGEVAVHVRHKDHPSPSPRKIKVAKGEMTGDVDFEINEGLTISGFVTDVAGDPIDGANVQVSGSNRMSFEISGMMSSSSVSRSTRTGPDGAYTIKGLKEGVVSLKASGSVYYPKKQAGVKAGSTDVNFALQKGGSVHGYVENSLTGEKVKEFQLSAKRGRIGRRFAGKIFRGAEAASRIGPEADRSGAFFVDGIGDDPLQLTFTAEGLADATFHGIAATPGERVEKSFELVPEARISGKLLSPDGEPVAGATLSLRSKPDDSGAGGGGTMIRREIRVEMDEGPDIFDPGETIKSATSSSDGKYQFKGVSEGEYLVEARHIDYLSPDPAEVTLAVGEDRSGVDMTLLAGGSIEGTVFDKDGKPFAGAQVQARGPGKWQRETARADIDGLYAFRGLQPGRYSVSLAKEAEGNMMISFMIAGHQDESGSEQAVIVEEGETVTYDIYDVAGSVVSGYVTEAENPVEGMQVELFPAEGFAFMPTKSVSTDKKGAYVMEDVKPGEYTLRLSVGGVPDPIEKGVKVYAASRADRDFDLPTGRVSGRVTDISTGDPVKGVSITLEHLVERETGEERRMVRVAAFAVNDGGDDTEGVNTFTIGGAAGRVTTDKDGRFTVNYLREGEYRLVAKGARYIEARLEPVTVREGSETSNVNLVIARGSTIKGKAIDEATSKPVSYHPISLSKIVDDPETEGESSTMVVSQGDGSFVFEGLERGRYRLTSIGGAKPGEVEVELDDGDTVDDVVLRVAGSG